MARSIQTLTRACLHKQQYLSSIPIPPLLHTIRNLSTHPRTEVDLRSDTVTSPSRAMLSCALAAPTGDDVWGEDPTVLKLQDYAADLFGKEAGLYLPTGTMGNLAAIMAHCHGRASEIIIGASSHICMYEGGGASSLASVHTRQIPECTDATLPLEAIRDLYRSDDDDHYARTALVCLENTHNCMGGVALSPGYVEEVGGLAKELGIKLHVDGARIFHAVEKFGVTPAEMCKGADSVSICLSKGLGAPMGTLLVGPTEFIRLAKRARKRCGGGMRQVGVIASMGMYALKHNVERLHEDHRRAQTLAGALHRAGFYLPGKGEVDTNIVYFGLPEGSSVRKEELCGRLDREYGVKLGGGYSKGGELFRAVAHLDVDDEGIERAVEALVKVCLG